MATPIKIEQEKLQKSVEIRQKFAELIARYGRVGFALRSVNREKESLENEFDELAKAEEQLLLSIHQKYGEGSLNIETGEFTPVGE